MIECEDREESLKSEVIVVSGLPRSGTSLMMQMLHQAGVFALTDQVRAPDTDNPRGYFEFEPVKRTKQDPSWLSLARGKVVKMVSSLLYDLPPTETYSIIFMERRLEEVLESQERMLRRLSRPSAPKYQMKQWYAIHLDQLFQWLPLQRQMRVLNVSYNRLLTDPEPEVRRVSEFLGGKPAPERMLEVIDASLYRNRNTRGDWTA